MNLSLNEARVIGCLLEKQSTTPDLYPLTLNALKGACNQKSNRDPVLALSDGEVKATLNGLMEKRLVQEEGGARASKYKHRFCNTAFGGLQLSEQERALVCVLLLRGPQTPGELRSRTGRLCEFEDVRETETVLQQMVERDLAVQLPREAGRRESRYAHLFSGEVETVTTADVVADDKARILELEHQIKVLTLENERLRTALAEAQA
ncbi:YceH family protein [Ferrimonas balearica]|uniref:YceH family protein n=1 Tax=Ferrimonas balearica TaxID=44012 RepID=UPI001C99A6D6|nr:YceH family protein [Ferrimonas balearica]MBY5992556.1 YceH family protein [Ferrimonas balearica]